MITFWVPDTRCCLALTRTCATICRNLVQVETLKDGTGCELGSLRTPPFRGNDHMQARRKSPATPAPTLVVSTAVRIGREPYKKRRQTGDHQALAPRGPATDPSFSSRRNRISPLVARLAGASVRGAVRGWQPRGGTRQPAARAAETPIPGVLNSCGDRAPGCRCRPRGDRARPGGPVRAG